MHEAATHAGMSPTTFGRIERGEDISVRHNTYAAIEQVIGWQPGSVTRVLEGGEPVLAIANPGRRTAGAVDHITAWESSIVEEIWANPTISDELKEELTARTRAKAAEARVIEDRLRRSAS